MLRLALDQATGLLGLRFEFHSTHVFVAFLIHSLHVKCFVRFRRRVVICAKNPLVLLQTAPASVEILDVIECLLVRPMILRVYYLLPVDEYPLGC